MSKQDRQGVRTAADLERKYDFGNMGKGGNFASFEGKLNQLNQSLSQFTANVTAKFNEISGKMVEKVLKTGSDKEYKTLSDNDLTDELKRRYDSAYNHSTADHAPANAQENVIEKVNVNGTALSVKDKAVDISVPVKVSELENDKGYLTEHQSLEEYAKKEELPTKVSELENDEGYLKEHQSLEEYAKKTELPTVPDKVSAFENDKGYLTEETDPTVPSWAKEPNKPVYNADEIGADKQGTAGTLISSHNTATDSHNDIRLLIQGLIARLDAVANSSDEELDQLSEIVAYIKSNKSLIDGITTSKVNVSDIVDNLTTNVKDKPLSATQGVVLKALIDAITVPTKVSELENDKGYLTQHQDLSAYAKKTELPTVPTALSQLSQDTTHRVVTDAEKSTWNAKSNLVAANKGYNGAITAGSDGVAEMGKYIDFHNTANDTSDYSTRFVCTGEHGNTVNLPSATGTLIVGDKAYKVIQSSSAPTTNDTSIITLVL